MNIRTSNRPWASIIPVNIVFLTSTIICFTIEIIKKDYTLNSESIVFQLFLKPVRCFICLFFQKLNSILEFIFNLVFKLACAVKSI